MKLLAEEDLTDQCRTLLNCFAFLLCIISTLDSILLGNNQPIVVVNAPLPCSFIFQLLFRPFPGLKVTLQLMKENKGLELNKL